MLSDPVAMTIAPVSTSWPPGASVSSATRPGAAMRARPFSQSTLFLRNRNSTPRVRVADDLVLARHHRREIEPDLADLDPVLGQSVPRLGEFLRRLQQCLRRDAADIEAGAAERRPRVDAGRAHAELRRADRRDIPARPGADHDDVVALGHGSRACQISNRRREGSSTHSLMRTRNVTASRPSMMRWS